MLVGKCQRGEDRGWTLRRSLTLPESSGSESSPCSEVERRTESLDVQALLANVGLG